ncbi:MAG TPA: DUF169 domain-containing protein [Bacillota bacterium]|nr:DUF169 domain-containing protein [Bacillota bacterium]
MDSRLCKALKLRYSPVAVILTDSRPEQGVQFKEGTMGCVGKMLIAASKGRIAFFDRKSFGCPGGGVGLGFGNQYEQTRFPIDYLLSTGNEEIAAQMGGMKILAEGERFFKSPELVRKWVQDLPITDVAADYVVFKPLDQITDQEQPELVLFFANPDQLSALVVLSGYNRETSECVTAPFGAACQSILFGYREAAQALPRAIIGFFDISQRKKVDKDLLSFTVPYKMFLEMEGHVQGSFLETEEWLELQARL